MGAQQTTAPSQHDRATRESLGLPSEFRRRADQLERYAPAAAVAWREAAELLESAISDETDEIVPIKVAAQEMGWSYEALRRKVAADPNLNVGVSRAPGILRSKLEQLPRGRGRRKAGTEPVTPSSLPAGGATKGGPDRFEAMKSRALRSRRSGR